MCAAQKVEYRYFFAGMTCVAVPAASLPAMLDLKHMERIAAAVNSKGVMFDELPAKRTWTGKRWATVRSKLAPHKPDGLCDKDAGEDLTLHVVRETITRDEGIVENYWLQRLSSPSGHGLANSLTLDYDAAPVIYVTI